MTKEQETALITLGEYDDPSAFELIEAKTKLNENGIDFIVSGEDGQVGLYDRQSFWIEIKVQRKDYEKAKQLIGNLNVNRGTSHPTFCPKCDSGDLNEKDSFSILPIFGMKKYQCRNCGHTWKPDRF